MRVDVASLKTITQEFFTAYDNHDFERMLSLCADGAQGRYLPLGRESVMPIRGGLDQVWKALITAVPKFRCEAVEILSTEGNSVTVQAIMSGPIQPDPLGIAKDGGDVSICHCYIIRYTSDGKINYLDCYWDNAVLNGIVKSRL